MLLRLPVHALDEGDVDDMGNENIMDDDVDDDRDDEEGVIS